MHRIELRRTTDLNHVSCTLVFSSHNLGNFGFTNMTGTSITIVLGKKKYIYIYPILNPNTNLTLTLTLTLIKEIKIANDKTTPTLYCLFTLRVPVTYHKPLRRGTVRFHNEVYGYLILCSRALVSFASKLLKFTSQIRFRFKKSLHTILTLIFSAYAKKDR